MRLLPLTLAAVVAAPALLGGCTTAGTQNRGLESVHQPVVARTDYALDLDAAGGTLSPGETERLDGWLAAMRLGYGDQVAVDAGAYRNDGAQAQVGGVVARYGLLLADRAPVTAASVTPGTVRVVVSRMRASVPGCPDYSRDPAHEYEGNTHSNYGCASNSNLAAMIANPGDLVRGQTGGTTDPAAAFKAIETYRKAAPTGGTALKTESTGGR
ncbi:MAG TPA: CpaD family pilus assembly protein [Sphingomonas sp.]|jgi:pilus assembly protein CpaD